MMPGTVCRTTQGSRALGMFCSSSRLTLVETVCLLVSMTGVSDVTSTCLRQPADAHRDAERHDRAGIDRHVLVPVVGEPGELGGDGIAPGREVHEVRLALAVRDGDVGLRADGLDRHAGQHRAGAVLDGDVDTACVDLCRDRRRDERRADERQANQDQSCLHPILLCVIRPETPPRRTRAGRGRVERVLSCVDMAGRAGRQRDCRERAGWEGRGGAFL